MNSRNISFDIIRILACILVILMHSPMPSENASGPFLAALSYFTAPCIGLFFMVSGALILPTKEDYTTFLRHRFGRVIGPTVFWTIIYLAFKIQANSTEPNIFRTICSIPFSSQGNGILWFMYTLTGLYLLAPILSAWIEKARKIDLQIVLILWMTTLCYPLLETYLYINESTTGILYYFSGYVGYYLLGYYLKKYPKSTPIHIPLTISIIGVSILFISRTHGFNIDFYRMFWYLSIFVASLCVTIWIIIIRSNISRYITNTNGLSQLANLSFGIYLCHIMIMREFLWKIDWIKDIPIYILQTLVIATITLLLSYILCKCISHLSFANLIIGYKYTSK